MNDNPLPFDEKYIEKDDQNIGSSQPLKTSISHVEPQIEERKYGINKPKRDVIIGDIKND